MEQYIEKSALVAEINQRIEDYKSHKIDDSYHDGLIFALEDLRNDFLDTLEVKEVDLKLTLEDVSMIRQIIFDYNRQVRNEMSIPNDEEYCKEVLKRFKESR